MREPIEPASMSQLGAALAALVGAALGVAMILIVMGHV